MRITPERVKLHIKRGRSFRDAAFMGIMRRAFCERLKEMYPNVSMTCGYITNNTRNTRIRCGLEKTHCIDALCIAEHPTAKPAAEWFGCRRARSQNRQLHKATILRGGIRKKNQAPTYALGFRLFDRVRCRGRGCFIFGRRAGAFDLRTPDGTNVSSGAIYNKLLLLEESRTVLTERRKRSSSPYLPCL